MADHVAGGRDTVSPGSDQYRVSFARGGPKPTQNAGASGPPASLCFHPLPDRLLAVDGLLSMGEQFWEAGSAAGARPVPVQPVSSYSALTGKTVVLVPVQIPNPGMTKIPYPGIAGPKKAGKLCLTRDVPWEDVPSPNFTLIGLPLVNTSEEFQDFIEKFLPEEALALKRTSFNSYDRYYGIRKTYLRTPEALRALTIVRRRVLARHAAMSKRHNERLGKGAM